MTFWASLTFLAASLCLSLVFLGFPAGASSTADYTRTPVLMVHGWFIVGSAGPITWATIKKNLVEDGWPEEYLATPSFTYVQGCDPDHAEEIAKWVDDLLEKTGAERVDIVAHSHGALNSMYYLRKMCGVHKVRKVVSLGAAYHGTVTACLDPLSCGTLEMCAGSRQGAWKENGVLADLMNGDETPGDTLYTCIWTKYDEIIIPASGGTLQGAENIQCTTPFLEHASLLMSDESYGYVRDALLKGGLNEDGPGWEHIPDCILPLAEEAESEPAPDTSEPEPDVPVIEETVPAPEFFPEPVPEDLPEPVPEWAEEGGFPDTPLKTDVWSHFPTTDLTACSAGSRNPTSGPLAIIVMFCFLAIHRVRHRRCRAPTDR